MSENIENSNNSEALDKKENNPISVRIDAAYKEMFEELVKGKDTSKKALLESMILNYVESDQNKKRNSNIDFSYEIALISGSINEILNTFKSMAAKAQDTIGSHKDFYDQQLQNLNVKVQAHESKNSQLEERNKLLEAANNGYNLEKEKLEKLINETEAKIKSDEKENRNLNSKVTELLEQINILRRVERENAILKSENQELTNEINKLKSSVEEKFLENESLRRKLDVVNSEICEHRNKETEAIADMELRLKKEIEIEKKSVILQMQIQYNDLQSENIKNLGIINQKSEEINTLKRNIEIMEKDIENLQGIIKSKGC